MWRGVLEGSWMADEARRMRLDSLVQDRLASYRKDRLAGDSPVPSTVIDLCGDLHAVMSLEEPPFFVGTCIVALLAELLIGSEGGERIPRKIRIPRDAPTLDDRAWKSVGDCLRDLRNAVLHPASAKYPDKDLARRLDGRGEMTAAEILKSGRAALRSEEMFEVSLRLLNELGNMLHAATLES